MKSNTRAYIIGNGITRKGFDLTKLNDEITFGCNAIYREYVKCKYIIAIDDGPAAELREQTVYPQHRIIVPPEIEQFQQEGFDAKTRWRSNAGMNCMIEAMRRGNDELICLGFDFLLVDPKLSRDNIFDGTENYGEDKRASEEDNRNRCKYLQWFINKNFDTKFVFVFPRKELEIRDIVGPNVRGLFYDQLPL